MMIYIVEAQFQSYDSFYEQIVGVFDDQEKSNFHKEKWITFFKTKYQEIFEPFLQLRNAEGDWISDEVEIDYYKKQSQYQLIYDFSNVEIRSIKLNEDWTNMDYFRTENLYNMMKQFSTEYNREHNLNKLIHDDK